MDGLEANQNGKKAEMNLKKETMEEGKDEAGSRRRKWKTFTQAEGETDQRAEGRYQRAALQRRGGGAAPHSAT